MNKTTKIILIVTGVLAVGVGTYFVIRYYIRKKKEEDAKKEVERIKKAQAPIFNESLIAVKNLWRPSTPRRSSNPTRSSNFSNFIPEENIPFFNANKSEKYNNKELKDIKGQAISDFQNFLEEQWIRDLHLKYKVEFNNLEKDRILKTKI